jgi:hypothetical protein
VRTDAPPHPVAHRVRTDVHAGRRDLNRQMKHGFPFLPSGSQIVLDADVAGRVGYHPRLYAHATDTNQMRDFAAQLVDIEGADSTRLGVRRRGEARARRGTRHQRTIVDQDRITAFTEATGEHQWIHVGPDGAANRPLDSTIAHGVRTLALIRYLAQQLVRRDFGATRINHGPNEVRFQGGHPGPP